MYCQGFLVIIWTFNQSEGISFLVIVKSHHQRMQSMNGRMEFSFLFIQNELFLSCSKDFLWGNSEKRF